MGEVLGTEKYLCSLGKIIMIVVKICLRVDHQFHKSLQLWQHFRSAEQPFCGTVCLGVGIPCDNK